MTGSIFSGVKRLKCLGRILRNHVAAEGCLNEFELIQSQAGDATVVGVLDLAVLAEGRAQEADRLSSMGLDLEMNRADWFQDGYIIPNIIQFVNTNLHYVWLHLQNKTIA